MVGHDPKTRKKYENIKQALKDLQDPNISKSQKKRCNKIIPPNMRNTNPEDVDPEVESKTSKKVTKTVYPDHYTDKEIDDMGNQALSDFLKGNGSLPYMIVKGDVRPVRFNSKVKGPDGKTIEVEGYVIPRPDGTVDYIDTHYPKF
ncbi:EndoU domain-containing protein [Marininema halotolerans]|nr:EndoU domain-containing protein [Marininema halotolerans]